MKRVPEGPGSACLKTAVGRRHPSLPAHRPAAPGFMNYYEAVVVPEPGTLAAFSW